MYPGAHARTDPDKPATIMAGTGLAVTYRQLDERSNQVAQLLHSRGLRRGDGIALCMENNARFHEIMWGAQRSGLYFTAISSRLTPGEAQYIIEDCGAKAFFISAYKRDLAEALLPDMPAVHTRVIVDGDLDGYERYDDTVGVQPVDPVDEEWEGAAMLYSSGTTGRPKGVRHPLPENRCGEAPSPVQAVGQMLYGFNPAMRYLSPAPLYHSAPLHFTMAVHRTGGTVVVMEHFDPIEFLRLVEQYRITHTQLVPTMFVRMLKVAKEEREQFDLSSLEVAIHAAAPCPVPVKEQMIEWWGPKIVEYYAGTEGNGFVYVNSDDWLTHKGTVGRPLTAPVHICDDEGNDLPPRQPGAIYFEGQTAFEYHNDAEKTKGSRHPEHETWSTLGDIGFLDEEGFLYLTDRKANMIISGGVNIYPQEAENLLTMHPKVLDVAVFGIPNDDLGEEVKAVVQPVDMAEAGPDLERELIAYCKEQLASMKCPKSIDFQADLPRHPTGKLYKRLLRDPYWEGRDSKLV